MANHLAIICSKSELRGLSEFVARNFAESDRLVALCNSPYPRTGLDKLKMDLKVPTDFLTNQDLQEIEKKSVFFARNWYRFDKNFEKGISFNGISLGFVHENDFCYFFKREFFLLKAMLKAIKKYRPKTIIVNRNGQAKQYAAAVGKVGNLDNIVWLNLGKEENYMHYPNFTRKKLAEIRQQMPRVLAEVLKRPKKARGKKTVFIRSRGYLGKLKQELEKEPGLNVVSLDEFLLKKLLNPVNAYRYVSTRRVMKKNFQKMFSDYMSLPAFGENFLFEGIDFSKIFGLRLQQVIERDWPEFVFLIGMLSQFFESRKPELVVLWTDFVPFERISTLLARNAGAKSLVLQQAIFEPILKQGDWIHGFAPLTADKIGVWGERFRKDLLRHEVQDSRIVVTGPPRFDALLNQDCSDDAFIKKIVCEKKEIVVFASQPPIPETDSYFIARELIGALSCFKDRQLVIKVHPLEKTQPYRQIVKEMNSDAIILKDHLYELLSKASVLVTYSSTVGLESMILGKPVIVFAKKRSGLSLYESTDAVFRVENSSQLKKALREILSKQNQDSIRKRLKQFVFEVAFKQDGKATERVKQLIKKMLQKED